MALKSHDPSPGRGHAAGRPTCRTASGSYTAIRTVPVAGSQSRCVPAVRGGSEQSMHAQSEAEAMELRGSTIGDDSLWYKDAIIYELHVRGVLRQQRRRDRRLPRADPRSSTTSRTWASPASGSCPSIPRRCGTTATTSPTTTASTRLRHAGRFRQLHQRGRTPRHPGDHRAGDQPHVRPAPLVPAGPARRRPARRSGTSTSGATPTSSTPGADHLHRLRDLELDLGPGGRRLLLAPLLPPPARPELRQPARCASAVLEVMRFWLDLGVDGLRLDAVPYLIEREGTNCENLPETHDVLKESARELDAQFPGPDAAGRGQPVARRRAALLRRRRRVPHGVPLPADAADLHGHPHRRTASRSSTSCARRRTSQPTASGRCSCATTTS